jgi:hypothetical protein
MSTSLRAITDIRNVKLENAAGDCKHYNAKIKQASKNKSIICPMTCNRNDHVNKQKGGNNLTQRSI